MLNIYQSRIVILLTYKKVIIMSKRELLDKTAFLLERLPMEQLVEVADFADFLLKKQESESLRRGVNQLNRESGSFNFLEEEEELYSITDLKVRY